eukprot:8328-Heterococcus_DN1.PRE.3
MEVYGSWASAMSNFSMSWGGRLQQLRRQPCAANARCAQGYHCACAGYRRCRGDRGQCLTEEQNCWHRLVMYTQAMPLQLATASRVSLA